MQGPDGRLRERPPQRQVLHRVAGEHHLGEYHDPGPARRRPARALHGQLSVSVQVTDRGVDLGHRYPQLRHLSSPGRTHLSRRAWFSLIFGRTGYGSPVRTGDLPPWVSLSADSSW
jgi:hypothetical protein